jgi:hypothetical protein
LRHLVQLLAWLVLANLLSAGACGPGGPPLPAPEVQCKDGGIGASETPPDPAKATVWLGTTNDMGAFRTIASGETLGVVHGLQGGMHVWGAARLYTPSGGQWALRFALTGADGSQLAGTTVYAEACAHSIVEATYVTVFLEAATPASGVLSVDASPMGAPSEAHAEIPISVK